jgi:protein SCO1/2
MKCRRRKLLGGVAPASWGGGPGGAAAPVRPAHPSEADRALEADRARALRGGAATGPAAAASPAPRFDGFDGSNPLPNTEVWTHEGRRARFYDDLVKDRVVLLNFFYTRCGDTCPLVTANLQAVQDLLGDRVGRDVFMYSISLQPALDTPEVLRDYAQVFGTKPGWSFLTGAPDDIERLRLRLGFASRDPELDLVADEHTGMLRYGNDRLERWAGTSALSRPEWIVKAVTTSLLVS